MQKPAAGLLAVLLVAGCTAAPSHTLPVRYTLAGENPGAQTVPHQPRGAHGQVLRLDAVDAPGWLDSDAIYYRLTYQNENRIAAYTQSTWVASPTTMLLPIIEHELTASPAWSAVIEPGNPGNAQQTLRINLHNFQQDFSTPDSSTCLMNADATVIDQQTQSITGQKRLTYRLPAESADAAGGVECLRAASRRLASDLRAWLEP